MDDLSDIRAFYNANWDAEEKRLRIHQLEADLTRRYLEKHLPSDGRILDIGFGTGFYTFQLARRGYHITAVELADQFVDRCQARADDLGLASRLEFLTGDVRTLKGIPREEFDAALLLGPLYHLVRADDRDRALHSTYACLKPDGIVISAWLSRYGNFGNFIRKNASWIQNRAEVRWLLNRGRRPDDAPRGGFRGYFATVDEIAPVHENAGFETITIAGIEPAISGDDDSYNNLEGENRDLWLDLLYEISEEQSIVAASRHILYVGRKI